MKHKKIYAALITLAIMLSILPFGNGAERVLGNRSTGACMHGIDLVRHSAAHVIRAAQEGIAFSFRYGLDVIRQLGMKAEVIHAGKANIPTSAPRISPNAVIITPT